MRGNAGELLVLVTPDLTGVAGPGRSDRGGRTRVAKGGQTDPAEVAQLRERAAKAEGELTAGQRTEAVLRELVDELRAQLSRERGRRRVAEAQLALPWWRRWLGR